MRWRTDDDRLVFEGTTSPFNSTPQASICHVLKVPYYQEIHFIDRGGGDMHGIVCGFPRQSLGSDQPVGQVGHIGCYGKNLDVLQNRKPLTGVRGVTALSLSDNQRRGDEFIIFSLLARPVMGYLLMRRNDQVATRTRRKIADYRRFNVDARFHTELSLAR